MTDTVTVTARAAAKLVEFALQGDVISASVRLDVIGGAASGFAYDLYFANANHDDKVFESEGVRILVRSDLVPLLVGSTIDWAEGANGAGFQVINPNVPHQ